MKDAGVILARDANELTMQIIALGNEGYRIINTFPHMSDMFLIVYQKI